MTVLVGLDVGTTGAKAIAIAPDGEVLDRCERAYPLSTPHAGWAEQDPDDWWGASKAVLAGLGVDRPDAIGLSGQMHGLVALDAQRRPLRPAILWNDQRTAVECAEIERRLGLDRLIALTGNRALTGFTAPKLLWLREHEPDVYASIRHVLLPKDYVRLRLCGELATDVSDASGTLLFDVGARDWSGPVCAALGVDPAWLPRAAESPAPTGETADGACVAAGAGDQAAGALGVGVVEPGALAVVLGTSGVVFGVLGRYAADSEARVHVFCHAVPETWHAMGVTLAAAGSLRWLRDVAAPGTGFEELVAEAAGVPAGADGLLFAPYLAGERTPYADPHARGAFVGLALSHGRGALVRAVLEGVAYSLRDVLDVMRSVGLEADHARVSGGGARSRLWLDILAAVLDLPLERTAVEEGAAYGAALLAGVAAGVYADAPAAARVCVRARETIEPDGELVRRYADGRQRFRALHPTLRPLTA